MAYRKGVKHPYRQFISVFLCLFLTDKPLILDNSLLIHHFIRHIHDWQAELQYSINVFNSPRSSNKQATNQPKRKNNIIKTTTTESHTTPSPIHFLTPIDTTAPPLLNPPLEFPPCFPPWYHSVAISECPKPIESYPPPHSTPTLFPLLALSAYLHTPERIDPFHSIAYPISGGTRVDYGKVRHKTGYGIGTIRLYLKWLISTKNFK